MEQFGRVLPVGSCKNVGLGGYIAAGGYGGLSPALGLGVDSVLEIKVHVLIYIACKCMTDTKKELVDS